MQLPIKLNTAFACAALRAAPGRTTTLGGPLARPSKGVTQRAGPVRAITSPGAVNVTGPPYQLVSEVSPTRWGDLDFGI